MSVAPSSASRDQKMTSIRSRNNTSSSFWLSCNPWILNLTILTNHLNVISLHRRSCTFCVNLFYCGTSNCFFITVIATLTTLVCFLYRTFSLFALHCINPFLQPDLLISSTRFLTFPVMLKHLWPIAQTLIFSPLMLLYLLSAPSIFCLCFCSKSVALKRNWFGIYRSDNIYGRRKQN